MLYLVIYNNIYENDINMPLDQTNKEMVLQNFMKEFTLNNRSIISDLFYAMNYSESQCTNCNIQIYNYQIYFFLVFHLEEVQKYKNNNYQYDFNNYNISNKLNIYDCFEFDRIVNLMSGENSMYCNYCKKNSNHLICTYLSTGPEILIILLNRGHRNELNIKINFPEKLNLLNYIELKNTGYVYQLIGIISHIKSGMNGQFIAYCKDPISNLWHNYNDEMVKEVSDFQNEVINSSIPYLLFYQKINE
jgi:ubiquitin C-terminal hydrolase